MDVVLLGVSDRSSLWRHGRLKEPDYERFVVEYAVFLANRFDNVIVTPDDGVYTDIAREFGRLKKKKPIAYYPDNDETFGIAHVQKNFKYYDLHKIGGDWLKLNAELATKAKTVICLGLSPGVLIELGFLKYHQKYGKDTRMQQTHLLIDERCISQRLPPIFEEQIANIFYYSNLRELALLIDSRKKELS